MPGLLGKPGESLVSVLSLSLRRASGLFGSASHLLHTNADIAMLPELSGNIAAVLTKSFSKLSREHLHAAVLVLHSGPQLSNNTVKGVAEEISIDVLSRQDGRGDPRGVDSERRRTPEFSRREPRKGPARCRR